MLQQTRVAVVAPAYRRFLRKFPTVSRLARADEDAVLAAWSGLGYYSRARALHRAARVVDERPDQTFPRDFAAALTLPGVGKYTAAAVLSIAYHQPHAAIDGNIVRVLSRLVRFNSPEAKSEAYQTLAGHVLDRNRPGDWNQALMELGQTVCLPTSPQCGTCPVPRHCAAYRDDVVTDYPAKRRRRSTERVRVEMTLLRDGSGNLLLERGAFPFLGHLWLPPTRVVDAGASRAATPSRKCVATFRHAIMHREFSVDVFSRRVSAMEIRREARKKVAAGVERRLFDDASLAGIGRSSLLSKALTQAATSDER
jgi:A/G-specific adenine glycosylase